MKLKTLLAVSLLAISTTAMSAGVMKEMFQMKQQLNLLNSAETVEAFQASANNFITLSEQAKATMPASLEGDETRFKGYQAGMQEVIDVVKKANEQAKAGKLDEAKALLAELDDMRQKYHKEYK